MSNNIDHILAIRAQTLSNNNYNPVPQNDNQEIYQDSKEIKNLLLQPLNLCLLITTIVMIFILFLLIIIYK
jgi:hypothetical protein